MPFTSRTPMSREQALEAIATAKDVFSVKGRPLVIFSERRKESRKIKFWLNTPTWEPLLTKSFKVLNIPFEWANNGVAIYVPLDVTFSRPLRDPL